jgi:hypothetical protein
MGTITRNFANNLTTSGLLKPTAFNNDSFDNVTSVPNGSVETGDMVFIKKLTASASATLSFVDGTDGVVLDDTYKEYLFTFKNIHPATNNAKFQFNLSTDSGSNYNVTKTTTFFQAYHAEPDNAAALGYSTGNDLAQSTSFQNISSEISNQNDAHTSGTMTLYNPSSTTFVKHFMSRVQVDNNYYAQDEYMAGYGNTQSAINAIRFQYNSGNIDAGDICLYGIA